MRPQTILVLLLALVSGLAAVWGVLSMRKPPAAEEMIEVVVALEELPQDEPIDAKRVEVRKIPKSRAPEGRPVTTVEDAAARFPVIAMLKGEPVVEAKLLPKGDKPETFSAVFALEELRAGAPIDAARVEVREVPRSKAPVGLLTSVEAATARTPSAPIAKGEAVVEGKLFPEDVRPNMAQLVKPGMRAFTIQTPKFSPTLAGLLRRGNRVDVLLTTTPPGAGKDDRGAQEAGKGGAVTSTIVQNVELLDVHENGALPEGRNDANAVTLLVAPDQATILDLAQGRGTLQLTLRNDGDDALMTRKTATVDDLELENVRVVVALADLPVGAPIDPRRVEVREVPKSRAPEDRLASAEEADLRVPSMPIRKGEFVVEPKLFPRLDRPDLVTSIPPGMRAFAIQTPEFMPGPPGLIRRGNRVDVLLTVSPDGSPNGGVRSTTTFLDSAGKPSARSTSTSSDSGRKDSPDTVSTIVLHNIELLDVRINSDPRDDRDDAGADLVTLLVTPRQAAKLNLAMERGKLRLSLRNDDDPFEEEVKVTIDDILPPPPVIVMPKPEPEPEPLALTVRTLRGTVAGRDQIIVPGKPRAAPAAPR